MHGCCAGRVGSAARRIVATTEQMWRRPENRILEGRARLRPPALPRRSSGSGSGEKKPGARSTAGMDRVLPNILTIQTARTSPTEIIDVEKKVGEALSRPNVVCHESSQ